MWSPSNLPSSVVLPGGMDQVDPTATSYTIMGLEEYITYQVDVLIGNAAGNGTAATANVTTDPVGKFTILKNVHM